MPPGPVVPSPADFCVCPIKGIGGKAIEFAQWLAEGGPLRDLEAENYDHAFIYTGFLGKPTAPTVMGRTRNLVPYGWTKPGHYAAEAEPHGARLRFLGDTAEEAGAFYGDAGLWSTGLLFPRPAQRDAIVRIALYGLGTPYSFLDYDSLFLHHAHLWLPGLRRYIRTSGHMICSQYVDWAWDRGGFKLFHDDRWDGDVMPLDLARLLQAVTQ